MFIINHINLYHTCVL